ncbi:WD domain, G-beta repeat [Rubripirellula lacrimiformis]|uniref:WD domain, G-beta repeat n=1 Tax=Rubripirellula lacrimiformis TaxID=1930273 RepID=A0A517NJK3_9BACT|nr:c-type cytochrome domain-containing protein [Rubripirellula lacrimiformis]QDT07317.1 WD domain, G-beta repeat [Rubripirellula lacrimiformis]
MIRPTTKTLVVMLAFGFQSLAKADGLPIDELPQDHEVIFSRDVAPVLKKNCVACHNASNEEGGVNLESVAKMKSSDVDDVLVPGKPEASLLFLLASHTDDPVMPPQDNDVSASAMNPVELALLRRWIQSGAVVDQGASDPIKRSWQPLPSMLQTVYGSAMTADGRLSAVGFGNQIRLFGAKSGQSIETLGTGADDQRKPAHDDFVQDLFLDPSGRHLVSAGYRNVKFWEMSPFESTSIPAIDADDVLATAMNTSGSHLAVLSRRGKLSVAEVGKDRWLWMKSFGVPDEFGSDDPPQVHVAVGADGHQAAIGWGNTIRIVRIDSENSAVADATDRITSMLWRGPDQLMTADAVGNVDFWKRDGSAWTKTAHKVSDQSVLGIYAATPQTGPVVAIDVSGKVAIWNETSSVFDDAGKLPAPALSASLTPTGDKLWITTASGSLGQYSIADKSMVEVAELDPVAEARWASDNWQTLVSETLVATHDKEVKQVEKDVAAEEKNLETSAKEIETKTKLRDEKTAGAVEAQKAAQAAAAKLAEAKSAQQTGNQKRDEIAESVKQLAAKVSDLETQLAKAKQEHADAVKQLAGIADAKTLEAAVKAAADAVTKADQAKTTKDSELSNAAAALQSAEGIKSRGEKRLKDLTALRQRQQEALAGAKAEQEKRNSDEAASKTLLDQSRATGQTFAVMAAGTRILTQAASSDGQTHGPWSLWSGAGDWLAELPDMPSGGQLVASGDRCVLVRDASGKTHALASSPRLMQLRKTIGSSNGPSPFADRVLCVDVDPSGNLLASGGGEPSRSGELMIWNANDGSLVRKISKPHADTVLCVRFSPDGKTLATGAADQMVKLWDVESGKLIKTLEGHTHHVTSIAWNINRRQLATGSADASVKIWSVDSGQATRTISGFKTDVTGLVFVGRDDRIGVACGDSHFRIYRTDNGSRETNAQVVGGYLYAIDSNRDGSRFVVGGAGGVASLIDKSGKQQVQYSPSNE